MKNKEKKEVKQEEVNPIDALFDPNNSDNITLYDEDDNPVEFEQIALIPIDVRTYAILRPADEVEGIAENEAFVFEVVEDAEEGDSIRLVGDDKIIDKVFVEYNKLLDEAGEDEKK